MTTPLLKALKAHAKKAPLSYHTPGHKSGRILPKAFAPWRDLFAYDLTEVAELDELSQAQGVLKDSQEMGARILGAEAFRYLVEGSSLGLQAIILACLHQKEIFVPSNAHRSILHGLILADARPIFIAPDQDPRSGRPLELSPESLRKAAEAHPSCRHLLFVSPTYHGDCGQGPALIREGKALGLKVFCDAAHGAHFPFHDALPEDALSLGADACVFSAHKTLPVATQGAYLVVKDASLVNPIDRALRLLQTSSPSYLLLASLEAGLAMMAEEGSHIISQGLAEIAAFEDQAAELSAIDFQAVCSGRDPFKLYIEVLKGSPYLLQSFLEDRGIMMEMTDPGGVLAMLPLDGGLEPLLEALKVYESLALEAYLPPILPLPEAPQGGGSSMAEAFFGPQESLPLKACAGRRAAETISMDPPGTAFVLPGSLIKAYHIQALQAAGIDPNRPTAVCLESSYEHAKIKG